MRGAADERGARERLLRVLRRYGWNATAFQVLEPDFDYWFADDDACVAYVETGRAWVVGGGPIAAEERLGDVAREFVAFARERRRRVAFFGVEQRFLDAIGMKWIAIGEQPVWDPRQWEARHRGHRSLKEQLRRARKKGVIVARVDPSVVAPRDAAMRTKMQRLIDRWMASRPMPPMAFLVEPHPFLFCRERRYYVARCGEELKGLLVAVPVYLRDGWFFEDVLRDPAAPNGTAEALVDFAMRDVAADGCAFVTLGLAPLSGDVHALRLARRVMSSFYNFEGLRAFKAKFRPDAWDPIFLAYPQDRTAAGALHDALAAFARGRLVAFAAAAVLRAPSIVLYGLAALLVPWIVVLAFARRWFPSRAVQAGWIAFDMAMCGALLSLARCWTPRLARIALAGASADAALTTVQAAVFNARRARSVRDWLVIGVSIAAPLMAASILLGGLRRRST